jgi:hypothetical protein
MKPIKKVVIKDEKHKDGYSELLVKITKKGDFAIDGCDAGELAEEMFGDWDYEYWLTISKMIR